MGQADRRAGILFEKATDWVAECNFLRTLLLQSPLDEAFKWRSACYTHNNSNVAMIFRLKDSCGISFFRGALLDDPAARLKVPGPNSQSARYLKVRSLKEAQADAEVIRSFIAQAVVIHGKGQKVAFRDNTTLAQPDELIEALADDPDLAAAFDALTPGRQRSWIIHIEAAKQSATRINRIAMGRAKILAGKGQSEY